MKTKDRNYWQKREAEIRRKWGGFDNGTLLEWKLYELEQEKQAYYQLRRQQTADKFYCGSVCKKHISTGN